MAAKRHSIEYLREVAHLRPRTNLIGAVARASPGAGAAPLLQRTGLLLGFTPLITASDTEGAGEMFRVSTLDLENLPRNDRGKVDFDKDFFGKSRSDRFRPAERRNLRLCAVEDLYLRPDLPRRELQHQPPRRNSDAGPEVAFANLNDVAGPAEAMLKYVFKAVLEERADDMQFFAERVDKDAIDRLQRFITADFAGGLHRRRHHSGKLRQTVREPGVLGRGSLL